MSEQSSQDPLVVGGRRYVSKEFFSYTAEFDRGVLVAGASDIEAEARINAESDFLWQKAAFYAGANDNAQTLFGFELPLVRVQIRNTASGRNLFRGKVPVTNVFGNGQLPFVLPVPEMFFANSAIVVTADNYAAGTAYDLRLVFIGTRLFPQEGR